MYSAIRATNQCSGVLCLARTRPTSIYSAHNTVHLQSAIIIHRQSYAKSGEAKSEKARKKAEAKKRAQETARVASENALKQRIANLKNDLQAKFGRPPPRPPSVPVPIQGAVKNPETGTYDDQYVLTVGTPEIRELVYRETRTFLEGVSSWDELVIKKKLAKKSGSFENLFQSLDFDVVADIVQELVQKMVYRKQKPVGWFLPTEDNPVLLNYTSPATSTSEPPADSIPASDPISASDLPLSSSNPTPANVISDKKSPPVSQPVSQSPPFVGHGRYRSPDTLLAEANKTTLHGLYDDGITNLSTVLRPPKPLSNRAHQLIKAPEQVPVLLPYINQHEILTKLQSLLEEVLFKWCEKNHPDFLKRQGWDCPAAVELSKWPYYISFLRTKMPDPTVESHPEVDTQHALRPLNPLRHIAVHRLPVIAKVVVSLTEYSLHIAEAFDDKETVNKLSNMKQALYDVFSEYQQGLEQIHEETGRHIKLLEEKRHELLVQQQNAIIQMYGSFRDFSTSQSARISHLTGTHLGGMSNAELEALKVKDRELQKEYEVKKNQELQRTAESSAFDQVPTSLAPITSVKASELIVREVDISSLAPSSSETSQERNMEAPFSRGGFGDGSGPSLMYRLENRLFGLNSFLHKKKPSESSPSDDYIPEELSRVVESIYLKRQKAIDESGEADYKYNLSRRLKEENYVHLMHAFSDLIQICKQRKVDPDLLPNDKVKPFKAMRLAQDLIDNWAAEEMKKSPGTIVNKSTHPKIWRKFREEALAEYGLDNFEHAHVTHQNAVLHLPAQDAKQALNQAENIIRRIFVEEVMLENYSLDLEVQRMEKSIMRYQEIKPHPAIVNMQLLLARYIAEPSHKIRIQIKDLESIYQKRMAKHQQLATALAREVLDGAAGYSRLYKHHKKEEQELSRSRENPATRPAFEEMTYDMVFKDLREATSDAAVKQNVIEESNLEKTPPETDDKAQSPEPNSKYTDMEKSESSAQDSEQEQIQKDSKASKIEVISPISIPKIEVSRPVNAQTDAVAAAAAISAIASTPSSMSAIARALLSSNSASVTSDVSGSQSGQVGAVNEAQSVTKLETQSQDQNEANQPEVEVEESFKEGPDAEKDIVPEVASTPDSETVSTESHESEVDEQSTDNDDLGTEASENTDSSEASVVDETLETFKDQNVEAESQESNVSQVTTEDQSSNDQPPVSESAVGDNKDEDDDDDDEDFGKSDDDDEDDEDDEDDDEDEDDEDDDEDEDEDDDDDEDEDDDDDLDEDADEEDDEYEDMDDMQVRERSHRLANLSPAKYDDIVATLQAGGFATYEAMAAQAAAVSTNISPANLEDSNDALFSTVDARRQEPESPEDVDLDDYEPYRVPREDDLFEDLGFARYADGRSAPQPDIKVPQDYRSTGLAPDEVAKIGVVEVSEDWEPPAEELLTKSEKKRLEREATKANDNRQSDTLAVSEEVATEQQAHDADFDQSVRDVEAAHKVLEEVDIQPTPYAYDSPSGAESSEDVKDEASEAASPSETHIESGSKSIFGRITSWFRG